MYIPSNCYPAPFRTFSDDARKAYGQSEKRCEKGLGSNCRGLYVFATSWLANADAGNIMQRYSQIDKTDKTAPRCNIRNLRAICLCNMY